MKQVTLVSLYGEKKKALADLIAECQRIVTTGVGQFKPYELPQVHATIIGLERRIGSPAYNANFAKNRERDVEMDFAGFLAYLRNCGCFPFEVQIGGFAADRHYPFTSRKAIPHDRSFSIQGDRVVMMGWPVRGEPPTTRPATPQEWVQEARIYPSTLDTIRHAAQRFGILHSFHSALTDVDNDLFFRIGLLENSEGLTPSARSFVERQVREFLSTQPPLVVEIRLDDVCVAAYEDNRLPLASTDLYSLADPQVTGVFVAGLFA